MMGFVMVMIMVMIVGVGVIVEGDFAAGVTSAIFTHF
jgi:hypothetical protein